MDDIDPVWRPISSTDSCSHAQSLLDEVEDELTSTDPQFAAPPHAVYNSPSRQYAPTYQNDRFPRERFEPPPRSVQSSPICLPSPQRMTPDRSRMPRLRDLQSSTTRGRRTEATHRQRTLERSGVQKSVRPQKSMSALRHVSVHRTVIEKSFTSGSMTTTERREHNWIEGATSAEDLVRMDGVNAYLDRNKAMPVRSEVRQLWPKKRSTEHANIDPALLALSGDARVHLEQELFGGSHTRDQDHVNDVPYPNNHGDSKIPDVLDLRHMSLEDSIEQKILFELPQYDGDVRTNTPPSQRFRDVPADTMEVHDWSPDGFARSSNPSPLSQAQSRTQSNVADEEFLQQKARGREKGRKRRVVSKTQNLEGTAPKAAAFVNLTPVDGQALTRGVSPSGNRFIKHDSGTQSRIKRSEG